MDDVLKGGKLPSTLNELCSRLPALASKADIAEVGSRTVYAHRIRVGAILPPLIFERHRTWLEAERAELKGLGPEPLWPPIGDDWIEAMRRRRIDALRDAVGLVESVSSRFLEDGWPVRPDAIRAVVSLEGACTKAGEPPQWHRLPVTYESIRHRRIQQKFRISMPRRGVARTARTIDIILVNLREQLEQAMASPAHLARR